MAVSRYRITTRAELRQVVSLVVQQLQPGDVIGLVGDLGSGKTTFVKDVCATLGVVDDVISPTFIYEQSYVLPQPQRGIAKVVHSDFYRLRSDADVTELGLTTNDDRSVLFIEWIEHAPVCYRRARFLASFHLNTNGERVLTWEERSHA